MSGTRDRVEAKLRPLFKLVSPRGTLLGTITLPDRWIHQLQRDRSVTFVFEPLKDRRMPWLLDSAAAPMNLCLRSGTLSRSYSRDFPDALTLQGITLEEFETIPDCTFQPGAGYLRSLVEGQ